VICVYSLATVEIGQYCRDMRGEVDKQLETFLRARPRLGKEVFIARGATVLGDVTLGDHSSVWFNAVLRGDINRIVIGHHSNVQDNAVLHLADDYGCIVGNYVTIGHNAIVHACTVEDEVLVGMGSVILDGAVIGAQSIIGARALVPQGARIPPGSMVLGVPGKVVRSLTLEERAGLKAWAEKYVGVSGYYLKHRIHLSPDFDPASRPRADYD
jgi:gamma-carbonic anhydrase